MAFARLGLAHGGEPALGLAGGSLDDGERVAGRGQLRLRLPDPLARAVLVRLGFAQCVLGGDILVDGDIGSLARAGAERLEVAQAVAGGEPLRGGSWGFGRRNKAVPAPEIALAGDEALARFQGRLQAGADGSVDDAGLAQAAGQLLRAAHLAEQRLGALGEPGIVGRGVDVAPVHGRFRGERCVQVIAKGGGESSLVARRDAQAVEDRLESVAGAGLQQRSKGGKLRLQRAIVEAGLAERLALRAGVERCGAYALLGLGGEPLRLLQLGGEPGGRHLQFGELRRIRCASGDLAGVLLERGKLARDRLGLHCALGKAGFQARPAALQLEVAGGDFGKMCLGLLLAASGLGEQGPGALLGFDGAGLRLSVRRDLGLETGQDLLSLGDEGALALKVVPHLARARLELALAVGGALGLALEILLLDVEARNGGGALGFGLAQGGKSLGELSLLAQSSGLGLGRLGKAGERGGKRCFLGLDVRLGPRPGEEHQDRLDLADLGRDLLVAAGGAGLPLQALDLGIELAQHVAETGEVAFGRLEPQLGLVAAAVQAGDAGGVLQDAAALLGLGVDDLGDLALAHEGGRAGTGRRILEQNPDVAGAHLAAVDAVGGARLALDPAGDLEQVGVVELGRRGAPAIVEEDRDLGGVAGGPAGGAGEDHVVHGGGPHRLVRGLAHHPAQRFEQVRLAAAVGADDAGQPPLDDEFGRLDERFEADEPQPVDLHVLAFLMAQMRARRSGRHCREACDARSSRVGCRRHTTRKDRVDDLLDLLQPEHALHELAVDEEVRRANHTERASALLDGVERVDHALILAAGVKLGARHPHLACHIEDRLGAHLLADPGGLLTHQLVVELEIFVRRGAAHRNGGGARLKPDRELADDEAHLAGVDVLALQLGKHLDLELAAVGARHRGVLDDGHRRIGTAEGHLGERTRLDDVGDGRVLDHLAAGRLDRHIGERVERAVGGRSPAGGSQTECCGI